MTTYIDVPITTVDTIEHIAETYLGDGSLWTQLASLNRLRYPYLSDDPHDRAGTTLARTQIRPRSHISNAGDTGAAPQTTANVLAGEFVVALAADPVVSLGQTALFVNYTSVAAPSAEQASILGMIHAGPSGSSQADAAVLATYGAAWVASAGVPPLLVLQTGVRSAWTAGTEVTIHQNPAEETSRVLGPGDRLRVPVQGQGTALTVPSNFADLLGIDLRLGPGGVLAWNAHGDIDTVSGVANLVQALGNRLQTRIGNLPLHDDYGDPLLDDIGRTGNPGLLTLANANARQAVIADPRVGRIERSTASLVDGVLRVDVVAQIKSIPQLVQVSAQLAIGAST